MQPPAEQDPMRWEAAADGGGNGGCIVITEDAPLPGASLGHMSFGGFSPALEAMQVPTNEPESLQGAIETETRIVVCLQSVRASTAIVTWYVHKVAHWLAFKVNENVFE